MYDRWFLLGEKRNELLALREVRQYGRDSFSDPDHVSIYVFKPHERHARGVRILGRTALECTPNRLALSIACLQGSPRVSGAALPEMAQRAPLPGWWPPGRRSLVGAG